MYFLPVRPILETHGVFSDPERRKCDEEKSQRKRLQFR